MIINKYEDKKMRLRRAIIAVIVSIICLANVLKADTDTSNVVNYKTKSSTGALLRSFAMPGWGQLYVESYWKAPIFFAATGTLVYLIAKNHSEFADYRDQYSKLSDKTTYDALVLNSKRESARDNRDQSAFYLLGVYALAAVDAYVGSHLYDFDVDDEYSVFISPKQQGISINFEYKINK